MTREPQDVLRQLLSDARRVVVFTGAGISTESGIPDYRSKSGRWSKFTPVTIQDFLASEEKRREYWAEKKELMACFERVKPNAGHIAIARMHTTGKLTGVITQNIDGLHQAAGLPDDKVVELHGTSCAVICFSCGRIDPWEAAYRRLLAGDPAPKCESCGGILKPNTISFGQSLDPAVLNRATRMVEDCDLLLAVGSILIVEPAASFPRMAKSRGARLAIVNLSDTPLDPIADVVIRAPAGEVLPAAVNLKIEH
ncbi:MAG: hypothetical protein A3G34_01775 [Candidatus Lindowbacteria bacterium RIFCSPLOWO2_12_FULL_62_27]|nr:MAG: hypothetical protein A3I06_05720 [Candidatus Lindowbacteria bacterium RIFCSPLOWO2_02_FULL_62_12]OGH59039.1 MAG: hypothetical protein A3G34_01775 [Candidatus Lindowbacteria bacterium RIFCSPLOWO2_12_FULL_62_27]